jgi:ABC transporter with metal-binding/Fe-S-binding domain ATP-binding protein
MFHHPAVEWTPLQAQSIGVTLEVAELSGEKEKELEGFATHVGRLKEKYDTQGLVTGAIASEYQRTRIDLVCEAVGVRSFAPLWRKNPRQLIHEELDAGFKFIITSCNAMGLSQDWLGKIIDQKSLGELDALSARTGINPAFEGGEAETFVLDGPMFRTPLEVRQFEKVWAHDSGRLRILEANLKQNATTLTP